MVIPFFLFGIVLIFFFLVFDMAIRAHWNRAYVPPKNSNSIFSVIKKKVGKISLPKSKDKYDEKLGARKFEPPPFFFLLILLQSQAGQFIPSLIADLRYSTSFKMILT